MRSRAYELDWQKEVSMAEMQAAVFKGDRSLEVRAVERPSPGPGNVLIRVRHCGICGSDLHFYKGELPSPPGLRMGHEFSGEIAEVGQGVDGLRPGDQVCVEPLIVCGECEHCRSGNYQLCLTRRLLGAGGVDGAFAEYVEVPAYSVYRLPQGMDAEVGSLIEPLAVAVHGLRLAELSMGERVVVLGAGTIGQMALLAAQAFGASDTTVVALHQHQAEAARALGASRAVEASDEALAQLAQNLSESPPDVVVEAVGGEADTLVRAASLVRPGGRVCLLGLFVRPVPWNPLGFLLKEGRLVAGMTYGRGEARSDFELALEIAARRPDDLRRLITHRLPLSRVGEAFETAADKSTGSIKVTVEL
jgi:2-desacetyl-2-hydroxyethyl bacteriochlorophyllide A dehydrogenase